MFISFQDKLDGHLATNWVRDFVSAKGIQLKFESSFAHYFHILKVIGDDAAVIAANLLLLSPISSKEHYATLSPSRRTLTYANLEG